MRHLIRLASQRQRRSVLHRQAGMQLTAARRSSRSTAARISSRLTKLLHDTLIELAGRLWYVRHIENSLNVIVLLAGVREIELGEDLFPQTHQLRINAIPRMSDRHLNDAPQFARMRGHDRHTVANVKRLIDIVRYKGPWSPPGPSQYVRFPLAFPSA